MIRMPLFYITALFLIFEACDYYDNRLQIKNSSEYSISFVESLDTVLDINKVNNIAYYVREKIVPGVTINSTKIGSTQAWPFFIRNSVNGKLNICFVSTDTLLKYNDWGIIKKLNLYEMYSFTEEELEQANWLIEYP